MVDKFCWKNRGEFLDKFSGKNSADVIDEVGKDLAVFGYKSLVVVQEFSW